MDFIFMLTCDDRTVDHCLRVLDDVADLGIHHIGFKDIGVAPETIDELNRRIKAAGADELSRGREPGSGRGAEGGAEGK